MHLALNSTTGKSHEIGSTDVGEKNIAGLSVELIQKILAATYNAKVTANDFQQFFPVWAYFFGCGFIAVSWDPGRSLQVINYLNGIRNECLMNEPLGMEVVALASGNTLDSLLQIYPADWNWDQAHG